MCWFLSRNAYPVLNKTTVIVQNANFHLEKNRLFFSSSKCYWYADRTDCVRSHI